MSDIAVAEGTFRLADVFKQAFVVYGRHFVPFIIVMVIASIPDYILEFAIQAPQLNGGPPDADFFLTSIYTIGALLLITVVTTSLANAALTYAVVQELRGRTFSIGESILVALRRLLPIFGVGICTLFLAMLGWILLLVPGITLACTFLGGIQACAAGRTGVFANMVLDLILLLVPGIILAWTFLLGIQACVVERTGVFASMSRSSFLTRGHRWQVLGLILLLFLAGGILDMIVEAASRLTGPFGALIFGQALGTIHGSFSGVLLSVLYFQLRVAREGIDKIASAF